jgi:hypothetical protein
VFGYVRLKSGTRIFGRYEQSLDLFSVLRLVSRFPHRYPIRSYGAAPFDGQSRPFRAVRQISIRHFHSISVNGYGLRVCAESKTIKRPGRAARPLRVAD